jgi:hypothetical protein
MAIIKKIVGLVLKVTSFLFNTSFEEFSSPFARKLVEKEKIKGVNNAGKKFDTGLL